MIIKEKEITKERLSSMKKKIFIYPTDTIYGIGCNAKNKKLVEQIREIKNRDKKPFSIIAPNKKWILKNCKTTEENVNKYLPGAYTLILKKKKKNFMNWVSDNEFIGIRIPSNNFTKTLQKLNIPIVTTSVNLSGEKFANSIKEINKEIKEKVDLIIDGGTLSGKPSILIKDNQIIKRNP